MSGSLEKQTNCILRPNIKCISHSLYPGPKIIVNEKKDQVCFRVLCVEFVIKPTLC